MDYFFWRRRITILSIDGGGIRGVLPVTVLKFLEDELQELENNYKVRLADYFDIIAGTSAGALITAMLASPVDHKKGLSPRNADDIIKLLCEKGPIIFSNTPHPQADDPTTKKKVAPYLKKKKLTFKRMIAKVVKPTGVGLEKVLEAVYNGENLERTVIEELGGESLLRDTSTNIVIPTYDISKVRPVIFSTRLAKEKVSEIKLRDIVVSSASAPYYFPPKEFEADGKRYKLIDGGLVANNPTLLAIKEASKLYGTPPDYKNYLILSLGTGKEKVPGGYNVSEGGIMDWFMQLDRTLKMKNPPILDVLFRVSEDIADMITSFVLGEHNFGHNYLRIQEYEMKPEDAKLDNANKKNLDNLKRIGEELIAKYVAFPNSETGLPNVISEDVEQSLSHTCLPQKNEAELKRFAKKLYNERRRRMLYNTFSLLIKTYLVRIMAFICFMAMFCFGCRRVRFI